MNKVKIKFCGLTRKTDITFVNALLPDYIGFMFAPKSRRYISPQTAVSLKKELAPSILAVGVFQNEPIEHILALLKNGTIDMAQLHGLENKDYIHELKRQTKKPVLKAFSIQDKKDLLLAETSPADYILLDNGSGGTGIRFDWNLLHDFQRPYFLAGGLNEQNIPKALEILSPFAVDLSSGIETNGVKDFNKMQAIMNQIKAIKEIKQ